MSLIHPVFEATGRLPPQPWMSAPETRTVIDALTAEGADVRFIGGCVRDALAGRPVKDIDIATPDPPDRVLSLLTHKGVHAIPTGIDHGTITAVVGKAHFEVTTLRVDVETDGRRARVAYTDDWIVDATRRDFTINTFSCTLDGDVFDPFESLPDLAHGRVQFVGVAGQRIQEDALRILRFFRFQAHYGRPPPDAEALAACRYHAGLLSRLSGERVRGEILRILQATDPAEAFMLMHAHGVLAPILPEAGEQARNIGRLRVLAWLETRAIRVDGVAPDALRRLAAVLDTDAQGASAVGHRLRLSNAQTARLVTMVAPPVALSPSMGSDARRRAFHRLGVDGARDLILMAMADERAVAPRGGGSTELWLSLLEAAGAWTPVAFPLRGRDVLGLGLAPGPAVGAALKTVEAWWEAGGCRADRTACLERLKTTITDIAILK